MKSILRYLTVLIVAVIFVSFYFLTNKLQQTVSGNKSLTVTDSVGRKIVIPEHPERLIFLNPSNLEIYYAVGGKAIAKPTSSSFDSELKKDTADIPEIGIIHSPNLEKIIALKPDLVIGTNVPYHNAIAAALWEAGIPLFINSISSYEDVLQTIDFYGRLAGKENVASEKKQQIERAYAGLMDKVKGKTPPRSLIIFGSPDSFSMATKKSFSGDLVNRLGGGNIADFADNTFDAYVALNMEYVVKKDPEVIFIITMGNAQKTIENFRRDLKENPVWNNVTAVKKGRIYQLPSDMFTVNPGTRVVDAMSFLTECLYPEEETF